MQQAGMNSMLLTLRSELEALTINCWHDVDNNGAPRLRPSTLKTACTPRPFANTAGATRSRLSTAADGIVGLVFRFIWSTIFESGAPMTVVSTANTS